MADESKPSTQDENDPEVALLRSEAQADMREAEVLSAGAARLDEEASRLENLADSLEHHHRPPLHFKVDGEAFDTRESELTADAILKIAGLDPSKRYLTEVEPNAENFKNRGTVPIKMIDCMEFISLSLGPTPTS